MVECAGQTKRFGMTFAGQTGSGIVDCALPVANGLEYAIKASLCPEGVTDADWPLDDSDRAEPGRPVD